MADHLDDDQLHLVNEYAEAFRKEFEDSQDSAPRTKYSKDDVDGQLDDIIPNAIAAIAYTLKHGTNENLKVGTARWLIDKKLEIERESKDPLYKFLDALKEQATEVASTGHVVKPSDNSA